MYSAGYSNGPSSQPSLRRNVQAAFQNVIAYRLFVDLERGWRITMPNLEQTGLLRIDGEGNIVRAPSWATFTGGHVVPVADR